MDTKKANQIPTPDGNKSARRKSYCAPTLAQFGAISQLTRTTGMGPADDAGMNMMGS